MSVVEDTNAPEPVERPRVQRSKPKRSFVPPSDRQTTGDNTENINHHATKISECWQKSVAGIIETGRLLSQARDEASPHRLRHGEYLKMIEKLPFGARTAQKLVKIAEHPVLSNASFITHLPASWGTLYAITELPDEAIEGLIADGSIHAGMERDDVDEIKTRLAREDVYNFEALRQSFVLQVRFMKKWRGHPRLMRFKLFDVDDEFEISPEEFGELSAWHEEFHQLAVDYTKEMEEHQQRRRDDTQRDQQRTSPVS